MTNSNKVATNQDDDPNLFDLSNDPIATDDTIEKVKAFLVELQPKRFRTIEALVARIEVLQAEVTRLRGLCLESMEMVDALDDQVGASCQFCNYTTNGNRHTADCKKRVLVNALYRASKGDV